MDAWTPQSVFVIIYAVSAFVSLGFKWMNQTKRSRKQTFLNSLGSLIVYGAVGSGLGMFIGYKVFGGPTASIGSVATGALVGAQAIPLQTISSAMSELLRRVLNLPDTPSPPTMGKAPPADSPVEKREKTE